MKASMKIAIWKQRIFTSGISAPGRYSAFQAFDVCSCQHHELKQRYKPLVG